MSPTGIIIIMVIFYLFICERNWKYSFLSVDENTAVRGAPGDLWLPLYNSRKLIIRTSEMINMTRNGVSTQRNVSIQMQWPSQSCH